MKLSESIVYLQITTWAGCGIGRHYYGALVTRTKRQEVVRVLAEEDAARLNEDEGIKVNEDPEAYGPWAYKVGETSGRFFSAEDLIDQARAIWKEHFPAALLLIEGDHSTLEPQIVLEGPTDLMARITTLWYMCEEADWDYDVCEPWIKEYQAIVSNHMKGCSCNACRAGKHRPGSKSRTKRKVRGARRKAKMDLEQGKTPEQVISTSYTD